MTRIFQIGDKVYWATFTRVGKWAKCPDCLGNKQIEAILATGERVAVDCRACDRGWEGSQGVIEQFEWTGTTKQMLVCGVRNEVTESKHTVQYVFAGGSIISHDNIFATEKEALEKASELSKKHEEDENKRFMAKVKDTKSWAWHVTYHRSEIKRLEKDLEYHRKKLDLSKSKTAEKVEA